MDEEKFNMSVRKFLKNVGITSQREIEKQVRSAVLDKKITGSESLDASVTLKIDSIGLDETISGVIDLE